MGIYDTHYYLKYIKQNIKIVCAIEHLSILDLNRLIIGALVAQRVKRWPTDLVDRVRSSPELKSSQP